MKKLVTPTTNGGIPLFNEDILFLANENFNAIAEVLNGVGKAYVVNGIEVDTLNTFLKTCSVTAGKVWINNSICDFAGYVGTYPFYIVADAPTYTKKTLQTGVQANVYATYTASAVTVKPSSFDGFITCLPAPQAVYRLLLGTMLKGELDAEVATRQQQISDEALLRSQQVNKLNLDLIALSDKVDTKVTSKIAGTGWIDIDFAGYPAFRQVATSGFAKAQYKRTEDGFIHFRGFVEIVNTNGGNFCTMPAGFQNAAEINNLIWSRNGQFKIIIASYSGNIIATPLAVGNSVDRLFDLNGFSYYADGTGGVI